MARTWLSIRVDLVGGGGLSLRPQPGRMFAAARSHTFELGEQGGLLIDRYWDDPPADSRLDNQVRLSSLTPGQQFVYVFDLGDDWTHLCTVADQRIDPLDTLGIVPQAPLPYWGWGSIPDQYGRRFDGDDGETQLSADPRSI